MADVDGKYGFRVKRLIRIELWLEFNFIPNLSATLSPYLLPFSDDIILPLGFQKSKDIVQCIFAQRILKRKIFYHQILSL
jgi:hypothetical protein